MSLSFFAASHNLTILILLASVRTAKSTSIFLRSSFTSVHSGNVGVSLSIHRCCTVAGGFTFCRYARFENVPVFPAARGTLFAASALAPQGFALGPDTREHPSTFQRLLPSLPLGRLQVRGFLPC